MSVCPTIHYITIVGGDRVIPLYRVPDETLIANESEYLNQSGVIPASQLGRSLFFKTILTDNFYGTLNTIPYRGRQLWLPDLAVGRIVESENDILNYLTSPQPINATFTNAKSFVSGYDFVQDQANVVSRTLRLMTTKPVDGLINDTWGAANLRTTWLAGIQSFGSRSAYAIQSINGHFTHNAVLPANYLTSTDVVTAAMIYDAGPYNWYMLQSIGYSIGCHSGLNIATSEFPFFGTPRTTTIDFPEAYIKQKGTWVGNTGFGYGDSDLIAYSERLSLNFTKEMSRNWLNGTGAYAGMPVGQALARAKRCISRYQLRCIFMPTTGALWR